MTSVAVRQKDSITLSIVQDKFFEYLDVSRATLKAYRAGVKQFIIFTQRNSENIINRETVIKFKQSLMSSGLKPATVALYLVAVRRLFDWLEAEGLYANVAKGIKSPKMLAGHKRDVLSASQLKACVKAMNRDDEKGLRDKAMFLLMATAGLRTVEVSRANISDIHEVQGVWTLNVWGKGHTEADSFVKLSPEVKQTIDEYLSVRGHVSPNAPLFASCSRRNKGKRLSTRTISTAAKSAMIRAGYDSHRLTAHSLRHSAATLAIQAGMSLQDVQAFMRHSNISITTIYLHDVTRLKSQCENAITAAIFTA